MKTIVLTFALLFHVMLSLAQKPDKALARIRYSFSHVRDTTDRNNPYTEHMLLVVGKNASVYTSYDKINNEALTKKKLAEQLQNQTSMSNMSIKMDRTGMKPTTPIDFYCFTDEKKLLTSERILNYYLVEEDLPKIDWKISKDTASFSGVHCQKATAHFKGRNWMAWFAPEMPFQSGPWKLNGLPGLIINANDDRNEVKFEFAGIDLVKEEAATKNESAIELPNGGTGVVKLEGLDGNSRFLGTEIKLPTDAIRTSKKDLDQLKEARDKDPQGFVNAQLAARGMSSGAQISNISVRPTTNTPKKIINNPIELPEAR